MDALYFLSLPFVSAFNVSQIFVIPLVVGVLGLVWFAATGQVRRLPVIEIDKLVILFLGCMLVSVVVNLPAMGSKNFNHIFAILAGYVLFYFGAERLAQRLTVERILHLLFLGYMVTLFFGIVEFMIVNFTSLNINAIIFRPAVEDYSPGFLDIILIRARSTFEESGYFAAYMGMMAPLMVHYLWKVRTERWLRWIFIGTTATCYFMAFSVSLFILLPFAVALTTFLRTLTERRMSKGVVLAYAVLILLVLMVVAIPGLLEALILRKFEGNSFQDRNERFAATIALMTRSHWQQLVFGYGPGSYFGLGIQPAVSVYLNFLRDLGLIGLLAYLLLGGYALINLFIARDTLGRALFLSYLVVLLFFVSTPIYFLPHYFLPLLLYRIRVIRSDHMTNSLCATTAEQT